MYPSLLTSDQIAKEIYNRHLKLVQEFLIRYTDLESEKPYRIQLPMKEFCKEAQKISANPFIALVFPKLQHLCALTGWQLSLSGDDWATSEFILCNEVNGTRNAMVSQIMATTWHLLDWR